MNISIGIFEKDAVGDWTLLSSLLNVKSRAAPPEDLSNLDLPAIHFDLVFAGIIKKQ